MSIKQMTFSKISKHSHENHRPKTVKMSLSSLQYNMLHTKKVLQSVDLLFQK